MTDAEMKKRRSTPGPTPLPLEPAPAADEETAMPGGGGPAGSDTLAGSD
jgi:hypothetical protein